MRHRDPMYPSLVKAPRSIDDMRWCDDGGSLLFELRSTDAGSAPSRRRARRGDPEPGPGAGRRRQWKTSAR